MRVQCCGLFTLTVICLPLTSSWAMGAVVTRLESGENLKIAAIGTSLTESSSAWFNTQLANWLNSLGPGKATMFNDGVGSSASSYGPGSTGQPANSSGLYNQLPTALSQHPDVLFIEFAMNDSYLPYNLDVATSKSNLKSMIDQFLASGPKTEVVVQTMNNCLPGSANALNRPQLETSYYPGYRDVISNYYAHNPRVVLVDNDPQWVSLYATNPTLWNTYVPDGIHPSSDGTAAVTFPDIRTALLAQAAPEPGTLVLLVCGLLGWVAYAWRQRRGVVS